MSILDTLESELAALKADVAVRETELEKLKAEAGSLIGYELETVKGWFEALKSHL